MSKRILVIGESCLDVHMYCTADRLCPDKPVPVLKLVERVENPGMAGNVHRNITSIEPCDIVTNDNWREVTKTRFVHKSTNHMFLRLDSPTAIPHIDLDQIRYNYDVIAISDYDKGFLTESDIEVICKNHQCTFLDTKKPLGLWAMHATYIKINAHEYTMSPAAVTRALDKKIIRTAGSEGAFHQGTQFPVEQFGVIDLSGAGDSFMAGLVTEYATSRDIVKAISFANQCGTKVVQERGVSVI